jgi:hypothetical protein
VALTATASQGFEHLRVTAENETLLLPGDPGITFAKGDLVIVTNGVLVTATDSSEAIGRVTETRVCPAASVGFPIGPLDVGNYDSNARNPALVPVELFVAQGTKVVKCTFKNQKDDTVIAWTESTRAIACTTGMTADDYPNGAILYIYEGTGAGQINVVEDYDHTGGAAELLLICHRNFQIQPDATSKFIVLSGEAASTRGVTFGGRIDEADEDELDAADGADNGKFAVMLDFIGAGEFLKNLMLPVCKASALFA